MSRQYLIPGSPYGGLISETLSRQYLLPNNVYLADTGGGAGAALEGIATGITSVSASLTTGIAFVGTITGVSTVTGSLTTSIALAGSILCVCTAGSGADAGGGTAGGTLSVGSTGNVDTQSKFPPPPHYTQEGINGPAWRDWFYKLNVRVQKEGQISWGQLSFLGSNITDIQLRRHNDLQQIQGGVAGESYHLTKSVYSDLNEVVTKMADYSVTIDDGTILADASGGSLTITILPAVPSFKGKTLNIKKIDTTINAVYITCSSLIDSVTTWTVVDSQTNMQIKCDGTTWRII